MIKTVPFQQKEAANNINLENSVEEAVPAIGWIFNDKGEVTLTSYSTSETPTERTEAQEPHSCSNE